MNSKGPVNVVIVTIIDSLHCILRTPSKRGDSTFGQGRRADSTVNATSQSDDGYIALPFCPLRVRYENDRFRRWRGLNIF
jgi:hypothetical protein